MRCERVKCRAVLIEHIDRLGRVTYICPGCARREAGICAGCPAPIDGKASNAKWCARCRELQHRRHCETYRKRDIKRYNAKAADRARKRRAKEKAANPRDWQAIVRKRTETRSANLSPAERSAIGRKASAARWRRYYQRKMLEKMRQESTLSTNQA